MDASAPTIEQLSNEIREAALQLHQAQERQDERDVVIAAQQSVDGVQRRYRELLQALPPAEQAGAERLLGRRVIDLRRMASLLPKMPAAESESTPDRAEGGGAPGHRRITGVSWTQDGGGGGRAVTTGGVLRVGGDLECWCGKCAALTTHSVVAMVGQTPKQVLCQVCNSRHAYRTGPARRAASGGLATFDGESRPRITIDPEAQKRAAELRALAEEVAGAESVKVFDPKQRYRTGDIISHPEYGRGKVENVLRSSLLVRFPAGGLKSLMLR